MLQARPSRVSATAMALLLSLMFLSPAGANELLARVRSPSVGLEFALIPAGILRMGMRWTPEEDNQRTGRKRPPPGAYPLHEVELDTFYMSTTQVTVRHWRIFKRDTRYRTTAERANAKYKWYRPEFKQTGEHPVIYVSYEDAVAFAKWLSEKDGVTHRLPTEAEWEYACRAGCDSELPWGDNLSAAGEYANLAGDADGYPHTSPVARFKPNAWGLHDMIGNVWEWCADWVSDDYYRSSPRKNPTGPEHGNVRAYRGGSWCDPLMNALPGIRHRQPPDRYYGNSGFRLVRALSPAQRAAIRRKAGQEALRSRLERIQKAEKTPITDISWPQYLAECSTQAQSQNEALAERVFARKYKGRLVRWSGSVARTTERFLGGFRLCLKMAPSESIWSDVTLSVPKQFSILVLSLQKDDSVIFVARIEGQGGAFLDHSLDVIDIWLPDVPEPQAAFVKEWRALKKRYEAAEVSRNDMQIKKLQEQARAFFSQHRPTFAWVGMVTGVSTVWGDTWCTVTCNGMEFKLWPESKALFAGNEPLDIFESLRAGDWVQFYGEAVGEMSFTISGAIAEPEIKVRPTQVIRLD